MSRCFAAAAILAAACRFEPLPLPGETTGRPCDEWLFTPAEIPPCELPEPAAIALAPGQAYTLDGETGMLVGIAATITLPHVVRDGVAIVSVLDLDVPAGAVLRARGRFPLAIAVWGTATIAGRISAASYHPDPGKVAIVRGAGSPSPACAIGATGPARGTADNDGDDGGGGGGFAAGGGEGGAGGGAPGPVPAPGGGGRAGDGHARIGTLEGGCDGAAGAQTLQGTPGIAGLGGGAIAVIARDAIAIVAGGAIDAGGSGGGGGERDRTGGGGGGSGGMVKLETMDLTIAAGGFVAANGGQGGGGCNGGLADPGQDGRPDLMKADSDNREGGGGRGGVGASRETGHGGGHASAASDGAGGGGGSVGFVLYRAHGAQDLADPAMSPAGTPL